MVTISYQLFGNKGFQLRLRLYQEGETKFINVTKLLKGNIQRKHWNARKQMFIPSCPFSEENNDILVRFRQKYDKAAIDWNGSVYGMVLAVQASKDSDSGRITLSAFIDGIIEERKRNTHADGSVKGSYELYEKTKKRLREFCAYKNVDLDRILLTDVNPLFVDSVFDWVDMTNRGKCSYISEALHSMIVMADKRKLLKMGDFSACKWRAKERNSAHKYNTLTSKQCNRFVSMDVSELPRNPKSELYRDFCIFILYTGQSVCDAVSLKYSDIQNIDGVDHFVFKRRKIEHKQSVPCTVPINTEMRRIMKRWKKCSRDGYVFPIRSREKLASQKTENGDIKHFLGRLNLWLKKVGDILGCKFPLHSYTFRHTAITHYISKNVPVIYVANLMGTSVENCENIYYNNRGDVASRNKVLNALSF